MVRFNFLRKHLWTIPPSILLTDIAASSWDWPRRVHLKQTKIYQLRRSAQAVPATPFGDWCRPLLPSTANAWPTPSRRSKDLSKSEDYKPAPWHTPSQRGEEFLKDPQSQRPTTSIVRGSVPHHSSPLHE